MLFIAFLFFIAAACVGITILYRIFARKHVPQPVAFLHGALALIGLLLLIAFAAGNPGQKPIISLILFLIASVGGITILTLRKKRISRSKWIGVIHGSVALIAITMLIFFMNRVSG